MTRLKLHFRLIRFELIRPLAIRPLQSEQALHIFINHAAVLGAVHIG